jgi:hypothetical protein
VQGVKRFLNALDGKIKEFLVLGILGSNYTAKDKP